MQINILDSSAFTQGVRMLSCTITKPEDAKEVLVRYRSKGLVDLRIEELDEVDLLEEANALRRRLGRELVLKSRGMLNAK